jgi:hypothetical protein
MLTQPLAIRRQGACTLMKGTWTCEYLVDQYPLFSSHNIYQTAKGAWTIEVHMWWLDVLGDEERERVRACHLSGKRHFRRD